MDKYKITSPKMEELKRRKAQIEDAINQESARLCNEKAAALCAEAAAKKARR
jgi:hypothetical protein